MCKREKPFQHPSLKQNEGKKELSYPSFDAVVLVAAVFVYSTKTACPP